MGRSIKVGIFVLSGVVLMGLIVFFIGDSKNMWEAKVQYQAAFRNVSGMKPGSPVRMGGVDIGAVSSVEHAVDPKDSSVLVKFNVVKSDAQRIRKGIPGPDGTIIKATTALVANKGFLGDKMLELTADGEGEVVPGGSTLPSDEGSDPLAQIQSLGKKAETILKNLEEGTKPLADPQFADDMKGSVHSLRVILDGIAKNDSIMNRVLSSPEDGARFSASLENLRASSAQLRAFSTRMNTGPGLAHTLVYDPETAGHAAGAMAEVHQDLETIRKGNGLAHALLYGDTDTTHLMGNVNAMSDDLRAIVGDMRKGRGTMGALLVDPTLYEDLRSLVGNMDRNQVLRALVRYSIQADESRPSPQVKK
jgi:phospholipid/cholesterol/gamma-HCH transport system substrate-binding protein